MKKLIRSRAARVDMGLFLVAAGLWVLCPYLLLSTPWLTLVTLD